MGTFIYKVDYVEPPSAIDYAIRYTPDRQEVYAKTKGGKEFKTDFAKNNTAFDVYSGGKEITKEQYDAF